MTIKIIEYNEMYDEQVKDLLVELQEYVVSIDQDKLSTLSSEYREQYFTYTKHQTYSQNGKMLLAVVDDNVVGLVAGHIREYYPVDKLDYTCPKMGVIEELIVKNSNRSGGIGKALLKEMESFLKTQGCEYVMLGVFAYNQKAYDFYKKQNYNNRMITMLKKMD